MVLEPGSRIGHYQVAEAIGVGGMGEVYRARDTTLERDVAIKVLPEAFADDRDRLARFEKEAKLLASLNHPYIAMLHGLENEDGTRFLVMELVEGETLAAHLARGPLSIEEALVLFGRVAEGLSAAHDKGIIHRDLKPANIMLGPGARPKILDFGLAKDIGREVSDSGLSESPTLAAATAAGVILGTAPYMSPEQARGKSTDKRTDIWSFGCVVYESLTGKRPFSGETVTDTIAAVVRANPDWSELPGSTPAKILVLLQRCLQKDPERRLRGHRRCGLRDRRRQARARNNARVGARAAIGDPEDAFRSNGGGHHGWPARLEPGSSSQYGNHIPGTLRPGACARHVGDARSEPIHLRVSRWLAGRLQGQRCRRRPGALRAGDGRVRAHAHCRH